MAWKMIVAATAALAAGCSNQPAAPADNQAANAANAADAAPAPADPVRTRYDRTITGQRLRQPPEPFQLLVTQVTYREGDRITCHKHPFPRYVYVQAGNLRVITYNPRTEHNFSAGRVVVEATEQYHEGMVVGADDLVLVAFELVPPGADNSIPPPPPPPASCQDAAPAAQ